MIFRRAKTKMAFIIQQVISLQAIDRRANILQSSKRRFCIRFRRPNENVKIPSGAQIPMHIDSDATHHGELNVCG